MALRTDMTVQAADTVQSPLIFSAAIVVFDKTRIPPTIHLIEYKVMNYSVTKICCEYLTLDGFVDYESC